MFAHEWAKYRYGVFEEYGYPGDDRYPMFYYDRYGELVPNYCTDSVLQGNRRYEHFKTKLTDSDLKQKFLEFK